MDEWCWGVKDTGYEVDWPYVWGYWKQYDSVSLCVNSEGVAERLEGGFYTKTSYLRCLKTLMGQQIVCTDQAHEVAPESMPVFIPCVSFSCQQTN